MARCSISGTATPCACWDLGKVRGRHLLALQQATAHYQSATPLCRWHGDPCAVLPEWAWGSSLDGAIGRLADVYWVGGAPSALSGYRVARQLMAGPNGTIL